MMTVYGLYGPSLFINAGGNSYILSGTGIAPSSQGQPVIQEPDPIDEGIQKMHKTIEDLHAKGI